MLLLLLAITLPFSVAGNDPSSGQWVIQLRQGASPQDFARTHHVEWKGPLSLFPASENIHVFSAPMPEANAKRDMPQMSLRDAPGVLWAEQQELRSQKVHRNAADPMYAQQWHLHGAPYAIDLDYLHNASATGQGVTIAIVDDGLQHTHPEIAPNYVAAHSYNFNDNNADPAPRGTWDRHGTSAAGVAVAAAGNGHCGQGVAPRASVAGLRVISAPVTDMTEAQALSYHAMGNVDIFSCSWGPEDSGRTMEAPGPLTTRAMALYAGALRGRNGKGSVFVWAAGNGHANGDSCAFDGYASTPFAMAIGALGSNGKRAWYSEECSALFAVTPSSGGTSSTGIVTADLVGSAGYTGDECTDHFGGTSASAPLAAGIIALMLQERPELTWRDVQHVIAKGAMPVDTSDHQWHRNARGYHHSPVYGFGMLKLLPLMSALRSHSLVPPAYQQWMSPQVVVRHPQGYIPYSFDIHVNGTGLTFVEHVQLRVSLDHTHRGMLTITLRSPEGTVSTLARPRRNDRGRNYPAGGWTFTSVRHWGERGGNGVWHVDVEDGSGHSVQGKNHFHAYQFFISGY